MARAPALHAGGRRFESGRLHKSMVMDDEILQVYFSELNEKLFDGVLKPIAIRWCNTRGRGGMFLSQTVRSVLDGKISFSKVPKYIEVSRHFARTEEQAKGILAHEMIHYYIAQENIKDDASHGSEFHKLLRRLNAKGVVNIPFMVESPE